MSTTGALERILARVDRFEHPRVDLEQYATPPAVAAKLVHFADLRDDLAGHTVVDLGSGPGVIAIGCAFREPRTVVGVEIDPAAIAIARANERRVRPPRSINWIRGDATQPPLCPAGPTTVLMNPPFGAQRGNVHADRAFLAAASGFADVSYSLHNAGSREFVEAFVGDRGGRVTDAFAVTMDLAYQFDFHEDEATEIDAEYYRVVWSAT